MLYANRLNEYPSDTEKRRLDSPEIFSTDSTRLELQQRPPVNHARAIEDNPMREKNWDGGTTKKQPRVTSEDSPPLKHYPRPPTYDPDVPKSQYDRLKALTLPRY